MSVLCLALFGVGGVAKAGPSPGISPLRIDVSGRLAAGDDLVLPPILLQNSGDEPGEFRLNVTSFADQPQSVPPREWFDGLMESVLLQPGDKRQIDLTLRVPAAAKDGDYAGLLLAERVPERGSRGVTAVNVAVATTLTFTVQAAAPALYEDPLAWFDHRAPLSYAGLGLLALAALYALLKAPGHTLAGWRTSAPSSVSTQRTRAAEPRQPEPGSPVTTSGWLSMVPVGAPFATRRTMTATESPVPEVAAEATRTESAIRLPAQQPWKLATLALLGLVVAMGFLLARSSQSGDGEALDRVETRLDSLGRDIDAVFYEMENLRRDVSEMRVRTTTPPSVAAAAPPPLSSDAPGDPESVVPEPLQEVDAPVASPRAVTVVSGDTAGALARRHGVALEELAAANGRSVESLSDLRAGEILKLPATAR